ncbi:hypothetical protein PHLGIDRAFT_103126 [Phlebiopsis gigantea 11061_1 CR5-6]|uniref:RING-type domain-containing protein n=1 Tax=Phlebiopsis gigantea (strain 11061_1 CR5-6) TaxID=745531 RepID=A0A0C3NUZ3_PHLG1|nr:hypothetical protein PHLGIDRAFT_103126 [Phlebiopsis gigantea 11061_1 CR5-6]
MDSSAKKSTPPTNNVESSTKDHIDPVDDFAFALAQQRLYDQEHECLIMERGRLSNTATFKCEICMDKHSQEDVALVDGCGHRFCRDCIRAYASSQLREHSYPIFCPLCSVEKGEDEPSVLNNALMQQIGLSEEEFATFIELEMASFSILVQCRSCNNSFFVVREELDMVDTVACPLPRCGQSWCKICSQILDDSDAEAHSCDGTAELRRLMSQQGWKYCPGCQTPAEKIDGCNHIKVNRHFCYRCGAIIVSSIAPREIERHVSLHYQTCKMFEDIPDDT